MLARLRVAHGFSMLETRAVRVEGGRVALVDEDARVAGIDDEDDGAGGGARPPSKGAGRRAALVCVDEAHHVYSDASARAAVERLVGPGTRRLLLSDASQACSHAAYPPRLSAVALEEVVRSSQRVVAGAMAFQLGGERKLLTTCANAAAGPPLKTFLFDVESGGSRADAYAQEALRAVAAVRQAFPNLSLDDRLALLVPDDAFRDALVSALGPLIAGSALRLVDAVTAGARLRTPAADAATEQWVVCDKIDNFDGLERLVVVCVGLDAAIGDDEVAAQSRRSMLYRGVTRAQLMVLVVNEFLPGGWLEFLASVRLRDDEAFCARTEVERAVCAAEGVVRAHVADAVAAAAEAVLGADRAALAVDAAVARALAKDAAADHERGVDLATAALRAVESWRSDLDVVVARLRLLARETVLGEAAVFDMARAVSLALRRGEEPDLDAAVHARLRGRAWQRLHGDVDAALAAALAATDGPFAAAAADGGVRGKMRDQAAATFGPRDGEAAVAPAAVASAVASVVGEWRLIHLRLVDVVSAAELADGESLFSAADRDAAVCAATAQVARGSPVDQAACEAVAASRARRHDAAIAAALRTCGADDDSAVVDEVRTDVAAAAVRAAQRWGWEAAVAPDADADAAAVLAAAAALRSWQRWAASRDAAVAPAARRWAASREAVHGAAVLAFAEMQLELTPAAVDAVVFCEARRLFRGDAAAGNAVVKAAVRDAAVAWANGKHAAARDEALAAAALDAAAGAHRRRLAGAAAARLRAKILERTRAGADLDAAVAAVWAEYEALLASSLVSQTVWDPSSNLTTSATGAAKFMPIGATQQSTMARLDYEAVLGVFAWCRLTDALSLALVCRRWRATAADPAWKPEVVVYAWGDADVTGLAEKCGRPRLLDWSLRVPIVSLAVANAATLALTRGGDVWHWGRPWDPALSTSPTPRRIEGLRDVSRLACAPPGYHHARANEPGYACAAVTRQGALYVWGSNIARQLASEASGTGDFIARPRMYAAEPASLVAVGMDYICFATRATRGGGHDSDGATRVYTAGSWNAERPHALAELPALRGVELRSLSGGAFHCCALTNAGAVFTFGHMDGADASNGDLLGHGGVRGPDGGALAGARNSRVAGPRALAGIPPVVEVRCSTYATLLIATDGRCFSHGDYDGGALGHEVRPCHAPAWLTSLRGQHVIHGALSYTNGAVSTSDGRVYVWGGAAWEGGLAEGRSTVLPTEVQFAGAPTCYMSAHVELAHRHGFLVFELAP
ncbi:hypothetical protein M885DRAFT_541007 [Pelagophyceae sp. CCMP2097]|nr:hypothetical protein M885DRAFT_541007 [Pelagophyceae sp. CCMP2097]